MLQKKQIISLSIYQRISNLKIEKSLITADSEFSVLILDNHCFIYGVVDNPIITVYDKLYQQIITGSNVQYSSRLGILENSIPSSFFNDICKSFTLPAAVEFQLRSFYANGNVNIIGIDRIHINKFALPFLLILENGALLQSGISADHIECRISHASIKAFKNYEGNIYRWMLKTFILKICENSSISGINVRKKFSLYPIKQLAFYDTMVDLTLHALCVFENPFEFFFKDFPYVKIERDSPPQIIQTETPLVEDVVINITAPIVPVPTTSFSTSSDLYDITYSVFSHQTKTTTIHTARVSSATRHMIPMDAEIINIVKANLYGTNNRVLPRQEIFYEPESIPQSVLDISIQTYEEEKKQPTLDLTDTFELSEEFKTNNQPFFEIKGNLKLDDVEFNKEKDDSVCSLCLVNKAVVVFSDCFHRPFCKGCAESHRFLSPICPFCNIETKPIISAHIPF